MATIAVQMTCGLTCMFRGGQVQDGKVPARGFATRLATTGRMLRMIPLVPQAMLTQATGNPLFQVDTPSGLTHKDRFQRGQAFFISSLVTPKD